MCRDTVAPEVKIISAEYTGSLGESIALPKFSYSDAAGVERENVTLEIVSPSGKTVDFQGSYLLLEESGTYSITIVVKDNNGIVKREEIKVESLPIFVDESKETNVLYSFDSEEYIGLVTTFDADSTISREIVTEGYPALDGESENNGVLKVSSTKTFGNVYTRFLMHEDVLASSGYRMIIRFALSTDTDYVKVFRNYKNLENSEIIGQKLGVKANTWYELEINPLDYGLYVNVKDFAFLYRDSGDTVLYIDEIYFTEMPFADTEIAENTVADFDEDGYLYYVYDNIFKDPTTDHGKRVPGSEFSLVSQEDAPNANGDSTRTPNLGMSGKALKMVVFDKFMGLNYFFPEKINVDEILHLSLRTYIEKKPNSIIVGFFDELGYDLGETVYFSTTLVAGEWYDWSMAGEALKRFTNTDEISGIYLQFTFADGAVMKNTMYIDEIFVAKQNETSEQSEMEVATFESDECLVNVTQNLTKGTAQIGWAETVNGKNGVLSVKSNASTDGFSYYFDEPLVMSKGCLNVSAYIPQGNTVNKLTVYGIVDTRTDVLVGAFDKTYFTADKYVELSILSTDVLTVHPAGSLLGLRFVVETNSVSENNVLNLDKMYIFDVSTDTVNPNVSSIESTPVNVLAGQSVDLSGLMVNVTDDQDPNPNWVLVGVTDENGNSIADEEALKEYLCKPTKSGTYTVYVKAVDWAGNESAVTSATVQINLLESQKEWYLNAWKFDSISDIGLVQNSFVAPSIVKDGDKTVLSAGFSAKDLRGYLATLAIDLGGIYKASEIENIVITLRVPEVTGSAGKTWYKAGVNVSSSRVSEFKVSSSMLSNGKAQPTATAEYVTLTVAGDLLASALGSGDTLVENIAFWNSTSGGSAHPVNIYIDSITVTEKMEKEPIEDYAEALLFNSEKSLDLVENSLVDTANGFNAPSIVTDGDKTVLSACFGAKDLKGYNAVLAIGVGGTYKASEIGTLVITLRVPELAGSAGNTWYKMGINTTSAGTSEVKVSSACVSTNSAKPAITSDYITITITGEQIVTAIGGDTIVNNIALWTSTSGGSQHPVNVYLDSIVINLA